MSQYPYPPPPQPSYYAPVPSADPLAPARRSAALMFVLGGLTLLLGACLGGASALFAKGTGPDVDRLRQQMVDQTHESAGIVIVTLVVYTVLFVGLGAALVVTGAFVRRGGRAAAVVGIVLASLVVLYGLVNLVLSLPQVGNPQVLAGMCVNVVLLGLFVTLIVMLAGAARNAGRVAEAKRQYAAYYAQYSQAAQAYGTGYGYPPPPTVPQPGPYAGQGPAVSPPPPPPPVE